MQDLGAEVMEEVSLLAGFLCIMLTYILQPRPPSQGMKLPPVCWRSCITYQFTILEINMSLYEGNPADFRI